MYKIVCQIFCFIGLLLGSQQLKGQEFDLLDKQFAESQILNRHYYGFTLYDLDSGKYIYGRNEDKYFTPASNTKVFTLFAALKNIGDSIPGIEYVERGDSLIFWGTGDPTFLHPKLDNHRVYDFLKYSGKKLFYVHQENSSGSYRDGWSVEDYKYDYQPDISVFPIYGNLVRFTSDGQDLKSFPSYFDSTLTVAATVSKHFYVTRHRGENTFELSNFRTPKKYTTRKPFVWSEPLLATLLADTLRQPVEIITNYSRPKDIQTLYSVPRNTVLREMMLPSDNFLAEHLLMVAAHVRFGDFLTDSLYKEMNAMYYSSFKDSIQLFDGSGLSTYNKITPNSMVSQLLALQQEVPDEFQLRMFFPAGGVDGTLRHSYTIDKGRAFIWAKTGTLRSVYCQSGYLVTHNGRRFAFSFLNNNFVCAPSIVRRELGRIMTYIHQTY